MALAAALLVAWALLRARRTRRMHLVADAHGNETLLVHASVGSLSTVFLVDTAYAGAPVISTSFLRAACAQGEPLAACLQRTRSEGSEVSPDDAVAETMVRHAGCRTFTSGCTMRLMSITETVENQSHLLLCPPIAIDGFRDDEAVAADVLMTNPLRGTPHILTIDYLLHRAPCLLLPARQEIVFRDPSSTWGFVFVVPRVVGGAFVVDMVVGGMPVAVVVDTGAGAALSLSSSVAARMTACRNATRTLTQVGVNGERVCSELYHADVRIGDHLHFSDVAVLANDGEVQGADGYAGMGLLRALDLRFEPHRLGLRRSGLAPRSPGTLVQGRCAKTTTRPQCDAVRG